MKKLVSAIITLLFALSLCAQSFSLISWNIQDFGKTKNDYEIEEIATLIKDYDIIAIQEVVAIDPGGAQAVARLADQLNRMGAKWDYRISDPTDSPGKKMERYAFIWKPGKVSLVGRPWLDKENATTIYREPYLARFEIGEHSILIANYHSRSHDERPEREIECFYKYPERFPDDKILIAGDFNAYTNNSVFNYLRAIGFIPHLKDQRTTLKGKCKGNGRYLNHPIDFIIYDWHKFKLLKAGCIDFVKNCKNLEKARKLSDHLPVWGIFEVF